MWVRIPPLSPEISYRNPIAMGQLRKYQMDLITIYVGKLYFSIMVRANVTFLSKIVHI